jgi:hypothetical protein
MLDRHCSLLVHILLGSHFISYFPDPSLKHAPSQGKRILLVGQHIRHYAFLDEFLEPFQSHRPNNTGKRQNMR